MSSVKPSPKLGPFSSVSGFLKVGRFISGTSQPSPLKTSAVQPHRGGAPHLFPRGCRRTAENAVPGARAPQAPWLAKGRSESVGKPSPPRLGTNSLLVWCPVVDGEFESSYHVPPLGVPLLVSQFVGRIGVGYTVPGRQLRSLIWV